MWVDIVLMSTQDFTVFATESLDLRHEETEFELVVRIMRS
jgi:hypothetical protein